MQSQESLAMARLQMAVKLAGVSTTALIIELKEMRQLDPREWDGDDMLLYTLVNYELNGRN